MSLFLIITAAVTLFAAAAAMCLRNLVHCALTLAIAFSGVAAIYLQLNAEFVGFTEILVYVGAVAILIVMAILLTRSGDTPEKSVLTAGWAAGVAATALVFVILGWAILNSTALPVSPATAPHATVKNIGDVLMTKYVLPLEIIALMLTAAMIGAVVIAYKEEDVKLPVSQREGTKSKVRSQTSVNVGAPVPVPAAAYVLKKEGAA
jgi:NADH-quinone oxidoreductase subunit J